MVREVLDEPLISNEIRHQTSDFVRIGARKASHSIGEREAAPDVQTKNSANLFQRAPNVSKRSCPRWTAENRHFWTGQNRQCPGRPRPVFYFVPSSVRKSV